MVICVHCIFLVIYGRIVVIDAFFFFKQKTAYEMRISDWSSDVCSSDLLPAAVEQAALQRKVLAQIVDDQQRLAAGSRAGSRGGVRAAGVLRMADRKRVV